jgi:hypothetical protein|tara:strand:- start:609 stop:887 length:279 start_codon:yes stop_codon:yes gene_type:complete
VVIINPFNNSFTNSNTILLMEEFLMKHHLFITDKRCLVLKVIDCDNEKTVMHLIEDNATDMLARLVETINKGHYDSFTNSKIVIEEISNEQA